jgi:hypothetical protein
MTATEVARYDRQIRVWGFETQRRLHDIRFLFIGITQTSLECLKNLVLGGASSISCVLDSASLQIPTIQHGFDFLHTLNPHCTVTDLPENFFFDRANSALTNRDHLNEFDVICLFNVSVAIANQFLAELSSKVVLFNTGVVADLVYDSPNHSFDRDTTSVPPIEQALVGALISQFVIDHLPPLKKAVAVRLRYDPNNWSSEIVSVKE